jgi:lipopolysaccharide heptosyltransferase II
MKILIVNPFGIGDVLFTTPLVRNLKENIPDAQIAFLCNARTEEILKHNPRIDEVLVFEKDEYRKLWEENKFACFKKFNLFLRTLKQKRFDLVIDLSLNRQYGFFLWLIGIKQRIGYNYRGRGWLLTKKINLSGYQDKHIVEYYLELLRLLGILPEVFPLEFKISENDRAWAEGFFSASEIKAQDKLIGIIPGGGASWGKEAMRKRWPQEKFSQLARELSSKLGVKIIVFGDTLELELCQKMKNDLTGRAVLACGKTTLGQCAGLMQRCALVVCNDSGPLHLAVTQNVKTVSIFGPVDEKVYGPFPLSERHIVVKAQLACRPCYRKFKMADCQRQLCLSEVSVEEVLEAIDKLEAKG